MIWQKGSSALCNNVIFKGKNTLSEIQKKTEEKLSASLVCISLVGICWITTYNKQYITSKDLR